MNQFNLSVNEFSTGRWNSRRIGQCYSFFWTRYFWQGNPSMWGRSICVDSTWLIAKVTGSLDAVMAWFHLGDRGGKALACFTAISYSSSQADGSRNRGVVTVVLFSPTWRTKYNIPIVYKFIGARGSVVVKALCYKSESRGFDSRWAEFLNLPNPSCLTRPWCLLSL
jgi:hypothetical protein